MRITFLTPGTGHFYCGSCLRDGALARSLGKRGHEVLVTPLYLPLVLEDEDDNGSLAGTERVHMGGINMYLQQKLPLARFAPGWIANLLDRPGLLRWASTKSDMTASSRLGDMMVSMLRGEEGRQAHELEKLADWLAERERPDVLCLSNVMLAGMARRLKQRLGVPIVCSLQGEAPFLDGLPQPYRDDSWSILGERVAEIDAFIAVSRYYGELMRERLSLPEDKVHVVHNGIDFGDIGSAPVADRGGDAATPAEAESGAAQAPTVGYLARMCSDKGLPTLVDAFLRLKESGRPAGLRLKVAGVLLDADRGAVAALRARIAAAGFGGDAEFLPNVSRPQKLEFLRSIDVLSVPATYGESFGLYILEAMAAGVPVVQPRHGAFPEIVETTGGGVLCDPDDPRALASALQGLLLDRDEARRMGRRGRQVVRSYFNVDRMAREVEAVCKMVAAG